MDEQLPSAEQIADFISDGSITAIETLADRVHESMRSEIEDAASNWPKELAIKFLYRVWEERNKRFDERFKNDLVLKWLEEDVAIQRSFRKAFGISKNEPSSTAGQEDLLKVVQDFIDRRFRSWGTRVIETGRYSTKDHPLRTGWIIDAATQTTPQWRWYLGVAKALSDYLYTDTAAELLLERKNIRSIYSDAIDGLVALERLKNTRFSKRYEFAFSFPYDRDSYAWMREALESFASLQIEDFYPTVRNDSTVQERLLVSALSDLHCDLFGTPKPHAIYELMDAKFIDSPIDLRNVQRICSNRRRSIADLSQSVGNIKDKLRGTRRLKAQK